MGSGLDFLLTLNEQFAAPATKAESALSALEGQIKRESAALSALEDKLGTAAEKLRGLSEGAPSPAAVAAFDKQKEAVKGLEGAYSDAQARLKAITSGQQNFDPRTYKAASDEVSKFGEKLDAAKTKLAALQGKTGPTVDAGAVKKAADNVKAIQGEIDKRKQSLGVLGQALPKWREFAKTSGTSTQGLKELAGAAQGAGGPLGDLVGKGQGLIEMFGKGGAAGAVVALVAVVIALVAAVVIAVVALTSFALSAADAARSARLLSEAAAGGAAAGSELGAVVGELSSQVPLAKDKLLEMARALELAKLKGREMQAALTAMGIVASAVGDSAAEKIKGIAESSKTAHRFMLGARDIYGEFASLSGTGIKAADVYAALAESMKISIPKAKQLIISGAVSVQKGMEALEGAAKSKFGSVVARQMLSLSVQMSKLKENLSGLFEGVNLDKFLEGLHMVTSIFDSNTAAGYALKKVIGEAFTWIFDKASAVFPYIRAFLLGIAIGALTVYLYAKKLGKALSEAFGGGTASGIDWLNVAMNAGIGLVGAMVAGVGLLAAAFLFLAAVTAPLWLPMLLGMALVIYAIYKLVQLFGSISDAIDEIDLASAATNMINGLVNGIKAGGAAAIAEIAKLAGSLTSTVKNALGIHSPSAVFAKLGEHTAEGFTVGIERGAPDAREAAGALAGDGPSGAAPSRKGAGRSGGDVHVTINIFGAKIDDEILARLREAVRDMFTQEALGQT